MSMDALPFTKMHGIGNDYVYIDGFHHEVSDPGALSRAMSPRHTGVGSDGVILVLPPADPAGADVRMRMFNADGSESEMCGNGIRCVCKFAHDRGLSAAHPMRIETGAGVLVLEYTTDGAGAVAEVTVAMGRPVTELSDFPVDLQHCNANDDGTVSVKTEFGTVRGRCVSMGNPHFVVFVEGGEPGDPSGQASGQASGQDSGQGGSCDGGSSVVWPDAAGLARLGTAIEHHPAFPERINIHFVRVHGPTELTMVTWERGSGATLACGTGASAVCVAAAIEERAERSVLVHLPGGDLTLRWAAGDGQVLMTGPATEVFTGVWPGG